MLKMVCLLHGEEMMVNEAIRDGLPDRELRADPNTPTQYAAEFHTHLVRTGHPDWTIYNMNHGLGFSYDGAEDICREIGCEGATWKPMASDPASATRLCDLTSDERLRLIPIPAGWLLLPKWHVAIARWHLFSERKDYMSQLHMYGARSPEDLQKLYDALQELNRKNRKPTWRIFCGEGPPSSITREDGLNLDSITLPDDLREVIHRQAVQFFDESTRALYHQLGLPHRRGILLWGKPGNGKTSIIRIIASMNPGIAAFCLQPSAEFNDEYLKHLIHAWRQEAPSLLVIEDIDWMLANVTVSTFLNLLDGVDRRSGGGQLLIATTNHPEKLDPAINNRPGRFDVAIEIPLPSKPLREAYFRQHTPELDSDSLAQLSRKTEGLSFCHLRQVLLDAGHYALRQGRTARTAVDYLAGASAVRTSCRIAETGFESTNAENFGFGEKLAG